MSKCTSAETSDEKAIRILNFNGKPEEWAIWSGKFLARARRKGYRDVLLGKVTVPSEGRKLKDTDTVEKQNRGHNIAAYEDLILSMDGSTEAGRVAFGIVNNARSDKLTEGDTHLAWTRLTGKYESKSAPNRLAL